MRSTIAPGVLALLLAAGCGGSDDQAEADAASEALTVRGQVETPLRDNVLDARLDGTERAEGDPCSTIDGYDDLQEGTQVVVADGAGETLALGELGPGVITLKVPAAGLQSGRCTFGFEVTNVPAGEDFYAVEVGRRGGQQYTAGELATPIVLTIG